MTEQTLFFTCPHCEERFAQVEEPDRDIHTGETYHCGSCGIQIVFQAVTLEDYVPPPGRGGTATSAGPNPAGSDPTRTRTATPGKETRHETCSAEQGRVLPDPRLCD